MKRWEIALCFLVFLLMLSVAAEGRDLSTGTTVLLSDVGADAL
ncbi:hypothetical protein LCGC14_0893980 [marine sediment metagenome]|uniref:Uncharacterized protein n=1 Tax=marine sediment metagenome TaxID=412755 RepID=A0A0F9RHN5_9ZZZZ